MGRWDEALHPRDRTGRFASASTTTAALARVPDVGARTAGGPTVLPAATFEARFPASQRLYRGVGNAGSAAFTRGGGIGGGDYGRGIYLGRSPSTAQSYAQRSGGRGQGVMVRAAVNPGAVVKAPPQRVLDRGSTGIDRWADDNGVDVVDLGNYQVIRNPGVLTFDGRDYDMDESVVLADLTEGYTLEDHDPDLVRRVRRAIGR